MQDQPADVSPSLFDGGTGFPPPGRTRLSWDEAVEHLVTRFPESETRIPVWAGLERYLAHFADVEERRASELSGQTLVLGLWMGGSFVSNAINPRNMDVSVILNAEAEDSIRGKDGAGWLAEAFSRKKCLEQFLVSPLALHYRPIPKVMNHNILPPRDQEYLRARGAWDDWWQRCRDPESANRSPTLQTVKPLRGYVEVML